MLRSWFGNDKDTERSVAGRTERDQSKVDNATGKFALYHYESCWFCQRVRSTIESLELSIELRDIHLNPENHRRLLAEGGSGTVPCLHIERDDGCFAWLYESSDICKYLEERFGQGLNGH